MTFKLDIFELLSRIDKRNSGDIYSSLSEDEKKGFAPLVVMRWMSGTNSIDQILNLNENVNPYVFKLGKHPHLLMQLLQTASDKKSKRYTWLPMAKKSSEESKLKIVAEYYNMSLREAKLLPKIPDEDIISMAESLGYQKDEITKLKK